MYKVKNMNKNYNSDYVHHQNSQIIPLIKEIVFGMEDGMVSTLGAISGIAIGSYNHFIVILSGLVIISVESISMGIGVYLSSISEYGVQKREVSEEKEEIEKYPYDEKKEMSSIFIRDGWPSDLAKDMSEVAHNDKELMLKEMSYRELNIFLGEKHYTIKKSFAMFVSYVIGGAIPLLAYFFFSISSAIYISVFVTLFGLFLLGSFTSKYTKQNWIKSGIKVLLLGGVALIAGTVIGKLSNMFLG